MAANKTDAKVLIGGKVYTLSGYESEEYIQKIASYLNAKLEELSRDAGYARLTTDLQRVLLNINLADDYFRMKRRAEQLEEEIRAKEKDLYDIKHELVTTQMKMASTEKSLKEQVARGEEDARRILELEAAKGDAGKATPSK